MSVEMENPTYDPTVNPTGSKRVRVRQDLGTIKQSNAYDILFKKQKGKCGVCKRNPEEDRKFVMDHDHETKRVRGLVHHHCNLTLGFARDDLVILRGAIKYIRKSSIDSKQVGEQYFTYE